MSNRPNTEPQSEPQDIDYETLAPLVRRALGSETVEVTDWTCQQVHGGAGDVRGTDWSAVYRVAGSGRDLGETVQWSLILKVIRPRPENTVPSGSHYWKREILAYRSGLLADLPGGLVAPRCFGVVEHPGEEHWIWLEDIRDDIGPKWPLGHYGVVARHLGQLNGAYLMGRPVPSHPWLSRGWLRSWLVRNAPGITLLRDSLDHPLVRRLCPSDVSENLFQLWDAREAFLDALVRLPRTFCHMDAFHRNLLARRRADGGHQTVAIDWTLTGTGAIGEEIAPLALMSFWFLAVELDKARELDAIVFEGYLDGLRDVGWQGDPRVVRFGYTAASALRYGLGGWSPTLFVLLDESRHAWGEQLVGRPLEDIVDQGAEYYHFLLTLAEEARELMALLR